jgi:ABC-2 type transport system permease protein
MQAFARGFVEQLRRLFATPRHLVMLALLAAAAVCSVEVYRDEVVRDLPVAVVDLDDSKPSRAIRTFLHATREVELANDGAPVSLEEAREALDAGRLAAVVLIPDGLAANLKRGRTAKVLVAIDASNLLVARNANKALARAIGTVSAGVELTLVTKLGERRGRAMARVVPIVASEEHAFNPWTNYGVYVVPPLVLFLLHVYVTIAGASLWLPAGPAPGASRAGAAAAVGVVAMALAAIAIHGLLAAHGIAPRSGLGLVWTSVALWVVGDLLWAAALAAVVPSPVLAFQVTVVLAVLSLMLAGVTWPTDAFPPALAALARTIPFTPFAQAFQTFLHHPASWAAVADLLRAQAIQIAAFALLALAGAALRRVGPRVRARVAAARGAA